MTGFGASHLSARALGTSLYRTIAAVQACSPEPPFMFRNRRHTFARRAFEGSSKIEFPRQRRR
jgi:hypothetical protein